MLEAARVPTERRALRRAADVRYRRQAYELTVPMEDGEVTRESLDALAALFHERHRRTYGHANPNEAVQLVNLRLTASGRSPELILRQHSGVARPTRAATGPLSTITRFLSLSTRPSRSSSFAK